MVEAVATGGQAGTSSRIENYLGFPAGISGAELAERAFIQAEKFGAHISVPAEAVALEQRDGDHVVEADDGTEVVARAVLIATGARYRTPRRARASNEFEGTSVYYAATAGGGAGSARATRVAVIGGGNSAGQATVFLSRHAAKVYLLIRDRDLTESMSRYLADRIERCPSVEVRRSVEARELVGDERLDGLVVENLQTGERETIDARYLFVFIGAEPHARWLGDQVALDDHGFVCTGANALIGAQPRPAPAGTSAFVPGNEPPGRVRRRRRPTAGRSSALPLR